MTSSKSSLILTTILALQLFVVDGAFMGSARKSALFNPKVTCHEEDLELTRAIIMNHVAKDYTSRNVVSTKARDVIETVPVEAVEVPALESASPSEDEKEIEAVESPSSSSRRRKFLSSTAALSSLPSITSSFITASRFLKVMPSLKGKIIRAVKKTSTTSANVAGGINTAASTTASMTLRLTDRGVKNVFAAAGSVVDWAIPTSLNLGDTSSTYRVTTASSARSRARSSGKGSSSILPLSFQLDNVKTMNRVVKEMLFLLQQM